MDILFLKASLVVYLISSLGYICSLYVKRVLVAKVSTWVLFLAFMLHTTFFIFRYIKTGQTPIISLYETLSFFAWAMAGIYLAFQLKTKTRILGAFVSPHDFLTYDRSVFRPGRPCFSTGHTPEQLGTGSCIPHCDRRSPFCFSFLRWRHVSDPGRLDQE